MQKIRASLTVTFEPPFWVGLYRRETEGRLMVAKVTFGAEPRDEEVYTHFLEGFTGLSFAPAGESEGEGRHKNPKRQQREIRNQLHGAGGIGTRAQQALSAQRELEARARKADQQRRKREDADKRYQLRREKKKQKKRGH